jgi:phosphate transport system substrate-binding protein
MKKVLAFSLAVVVVAGLALCGAGCGQKAVSGTITVSGAWALYPMAVKWAEEFQKTHPEIKIDVAAGGAGKGMADCLAGAVDIGMISREITPEEESKGAWWVPVTIDAVIPTVSADNPLLQDLLARGATQKSLAGVWVDASVKTWGQVLGTSDAREIHVYTRSDACGAAETWAKYLGVKQEDLVGVGVYGDPGLAEAVRQDALGIGYNNVNFAFDAKTLTPAAGIAVLPLDLNENGAVDSDESFYGTRDALVAAIATGKYPSPPARDLYFAFLGKPTSPAVLEFVRWVLTDGQRYVPETGYVNLTDEKLAAALAKLGE